MTDPRLAESWMRGVAANPAAPPEALLRLLDPAGEAAWVVLCRERDLPVVLVEEVLRHPHRAVRRAFARNPFADPAQRARLADDPDDLVRCDLAGGPRPRAKYPRPLPDEAVLKIMRGEHRDGGDDVSEPIVTTIEIMQELVCSFQIRRGIQHDLLGHPDPGHRAWAAQWWRELSAEERDALLADPAPEVQEAVRWQLRREDPEAMAAALPEKDCHARMGLLTNSAVTLAVAEQCLASRRNLTSLAYNPYTPPAIVERLARDPDPSVRERVIGRPVLDPALVAELADDPEPIVRTRARMRQFARSEVQRAAINEMVGQGADEIGHVQHPSPLGAEAIADWAVSDVPLLRRIAATCDDLPAELAAKLAQDPDPDVRHLLAMNHPDGPPALLIEAFIACRHQRAHLLARPQMPRTGLARLADHDDPELRALAAGDPTRGQDLDAALIDPDPRVWRAAAANPALARDWLTELLTDPDMAEAAAANPQLSVSQIHELLDRAGIPERLSSRRSDP